MSVIISLDISGVDYPDCSPKTDIYPGAGVSLNFPDLNLYLINVTTYKRAIFLQHESYSSTHSDPGAVAGFHIG